MDENLLLIEIISTLFVAKLVEQKILKRTEINDAFEALVDYQNELYGVNYKIILNEEDCSLNLKSYLESIRITGNLINKLLKQTNKHPKKKMRLSLTKSNETLLMNLDLSEKA